MAVARRVARPANERPGLATEHCRSRIRDPGSGSRSPHCTHASGGRFARAGAHTGRGTAGPERAVRGDIAGSKRPAHGDAANARAKRCRFQGDNPFGLRRCSKRSRRNPADPPDGRSGCSAECPARTRLRSLRRAGVEPSRIARACARCGAGGDRGRAPGAANPGPRYCNRAGRGRSDRRRWVVCALAAWDRTGRHHGDPLKPTCRGCNPGKTAGAGDDADTTRPGEDSARARASHRRSRTCACSQSGAGHRPRAIAAAVIRIASRAGSRPCAKAGDGAERREA